LIHDRVRPFALVTATEVMAMAEPPVPEQVILKVLDADNGPV
jgi:hypothetical protein